MKKRLILIIAVIAGLAVVVNADVTIQRKSVLSSLMGLGGSESQDNQFIKADKSCHDMSTAFTSGMMKKLTGGKASGESQIVRLDRQLVWNLDPQKKTYTEMTFAAMKEMMKQAMAQMGDSGLKSDDENLYTWTIEMQPAGNNETVNGFDCKYAAGKAVGVNKRTPADTVIIDYQNWFGQNVAGEKELRQYEENYAAALGLDKMEIQQGMQQFLNSYGEQFKKLADNFKDVGGYPIKTIIEVTKIGAAKKVSETGEQEEKESQSGIMGKLGGKLGKMMAQKDDKGGGPAKPFSMTTEVLKIETSTIDDGKFEIPAGYKKIEKK
jgi:hypothetical protein